MIRRSLTIGLPIPTLLLVAATSVVGGAAEFVEHGRTLFEKQWAPQVPSDKQGDGLGPYFNERSCAGCHKLGGVGGGGPNENNVQLMILMPRSRMEEIRSPFGGRPPSPGEVRAVVLHRQSTLPGYPGIRM